MPRWRRTPPRGSASERRLVRAARALLARRSEPWATEPGARLDYLERELAEVRTRINGLFFAVLAAVLIEALSRVLL